MQYRVASLIIDLIWALIRDYSAVILATFTTLPDLIISFGASDGATKPKLT
jgi:hypothetical protein